MILFYFWAGLNQFMKLVDCPWTNKMVETVHWILLCPLLLWTNIILPSQHKISYHHIHCVYKNSTASQQVTAAPSNNFCKRTRENLCLIDTIHICLARLFGTPFYQIDYFTALVIIKIANLLCKVLARAHALLCQSGLSRADTFTVYCLSLGENNRLKKLLPKLRWFKVKITSIERGSSVSLKGVISF